MLVIVAQPKRLQPAEPGKVVVQPPGGDAFEGRKEETEPGVQGVKRFPTTVIWDHPRWRGEH